MSRVPRQASSDELPAAFTLLFAHHGPAEREYRVARALDYITQGDLDPAGLFIVGPPGSPHGVILCQPVAGRGALIWPPFVQDTAESPVQQALLVQRACVWLEQQGSRLVQCLLGDEELPQADALLQHGFRHVTGLSYLRHDLRILPVEESIPFTLSCYDPQFPESFHAALLRTYEDTLDCPEVNGVRSVEDVVSGHKVQGKFDPSRWWLAWREEQAVGVLLMMEQGSGEWDIAYIGIVKAARRHGLGRALLMHGLQQAKKAGAEAVTLSVDDRNRPARALYEQVGFRQYDHRQVLLSVWDKT